MFKKMHTKYKDIPSQVSAELYQQVLDRDGCCCRVCGSFQNLECHHIVNRGAMGKSDICNLVMLCKTCHSKAGSGRGEWSKSNYEQCTHIQPVEAFIHSYNFKSIKCIIHNQTVEI